MLLFELLPFIGLGHQAGDHDRIRGECVLAFRHGRLGAGNVDANIDAIDRLADLDRGLGIRRGDDREPRHGVEAGVVEARPDGFQLLDAQLGLGELRGQGSKAGDVDGGLGEFGLVLKGQVAVLIGVDFLIELAQFLPIGPAHRVPILLTLLRAQLGELLDHDFGPFCRPRRDIGPDFDFEIAGRVGGDQQLADVTAFDLPMLGDEAEAGGGALGYFGPVELGDHGADVAIVVNRIGVQGQPEGIHLDQGTRVINGTGIDVNDQAAKEAHADQEDHQAQVLADQCHIQHQVVKIEDSFIDSWNHRRGIGILRITQSAVQFKTR